MKSSQGSRQQSIQNSHLLENYFKMEVSNNHCHSVKTDMLHGCIFYRINLSPGVAVATAILDKIVTFWVKLDQDFNYVKP